MTTTTTIALSLKFPLLVGAIALFVACGGGDPTPTQPTQPTQRQDATCSAKVAASTLGYVVNGDQLTLKAPNGQTLTLKRAQAIPGDRPVYGQWLLSNEATLRAIMQIAPGTVATIATCRTPDGRHTEAAAASPARITDTTIEILESHEERLTFSEPLVDGAE